MDPLRKGRLTREEALQCLHNDVKTIGEIESRWEKYGMTEARRKITSEARLLAISDFFKWEKEDRRRKRAQSKSNSA